MKEKEFNLSEKRKMFVNPSGWKEAYPTEDVKEFIRRLKEELKNMGILGFLERPQESNIRTIINKLAGEELSK